VSLLLLYVRLRRRPPISTLFPYTTLFRSLEVQDRAQRGGPGFEYLLMVANQKPAFQLFTTPQNFTVASGGDAELKVHLIREAGFDGKVDVWLEGLPAGVQTSRGQFRADQLFEPNADGADMIIPEISFRIHVPESIPVGSYTIRAYGAPADDPDDTSKRVEAHATIMIGPLLDLWNFIRRPLPAITMTVVQPFSAELLTDVRTLRLERGKSATIELKAENVPEDAQFRLLDLPEGVQYRVLGRQGAQVTVALEAGMEAKEGTFEISAETDVGSRRAPSPSIALFIHVSNGR